MERGMDNLQIKDDEEVRWDNNGEQNAQGSIYEFCLVGCCLTTSVVYFPALRMTMMNLWHHFGGDQISELGDKRYLFKFFNKIDIERVENGSPWTFNNHLLILHQLRDDEDPLLIPLIFSNFWVQMHDLPLGFFSERMAKQFRDFISSFVEYDTKQGSGVLLRRASVDSSIWLRKDGDDGLFDTNKKMRIWDHDLEDDPIQVGEGKKRPRSAYFSSKKSCSTSNNSTNGEKMQALQISVAAKGHVTRMEKVRMECGFLCGIDVGADGSREKGGIPRDDRMIEEFRNMLEDCALEDIGYIGHWFTWECGNLRETNIKERLDREVTMSALTKKLSQRLEELNQKDRTDEVLAEIINVKIDFNFEVKKEKRFWEHHFNKIRGLQDADRRIVSHSVDIERVAMNYFNDLFSSKGIGDTTHLLSGVNRCVTIEMNNGLTTEFKVEEVQKALKFIGPTKSVGENGFIVLFYQKHWHITRGEVSNFCLDIDRLFNVTAIMCKRTLSMQ
ncbi:hypothetical protein Gogos_022353, partial [Gossypium gossypioides]|nr:hypothetical protein [Gossypium gossypioides]